MALTLPEIEEAVLRAGFVRNSSTSKVIEFKSKRSGRRLYVYQKQGLPDHADVMVHPEMDPASLFAIDGVRPNKRVEFRFGSNMAEFPKRLNKGAAPEHFGRALYVLSPAALSSLCRVYDN
ncbi:hypothetical protein MW290_18685 [Aquincola tertiaricarbonis]|uniref:Uncharacterized protein n=1 Tax=Aquincola tertiaricarbonis TaxID=391953 RepID=A0ABY4SGU5_AQUTE|nr:hypothetical protein [Aquincola tertiaricarbonis]URI10998.1 hypothetical protein MW290_18685 [Aquincola tertiaricarbonis]